MLIVWMRPWYRLERRIVLAGLLSRVVALTDPLALQTIPTGRSGFVALSRIEYQYQYRYGPWLLGSSVKVLESGGLRSLQ